MAEPSTTSGVKPLTEAEQKTLDDLTARKAAAAAEQAEQARKDKLASLASVDALVKAVRNDKVTAAFDAVLNDPAVDFDTKAKVQAARSSMDYNLGSLADVLNQLANPAPTPLVTP